MVHILSPYSINKDLGKAYNVAMSGIPDGDWACLTDYDTMLLTPDAGKILNQYAELFPDAGLMTCWTNRIHPLAMSQLLNGVVSSNDRIRDHIEIAEQQKKSLYKVKELKHEVSGFLMMISKKTWKEIQFSETGKALGIDNDYCWRLLAAGKTILRMDGLYVWHTYRLANGVTNKDHLR